MILRGLLQRCTWLLLSLTTAAVCLAGIAVIRAEEAAPARPPVPKVLKLTVLPAALTLEDSRDARSLIVTGQTAAGYAVDLSQVAAIQPESDLVRVDKEGYIQ